MKDRGRISPIGRLLADRSGSAMVEFALILPMLVLMTLISFDIGRAFFAYTSLQHVASDTARMASLHGRESLSPSSADQISAYAISRAVGLDPAAIEVRLHYNPSDASGGEVTVEILYNHQIFVGKMLNAPPLAMVGSATMTVL